MEIGVVGLGNMGSGIAGSMARQFPCTVYDIVSSRAETFAGERPGVRVADSLKGLAHACTDVFVVVQDEPQLRAVVLGDGGLRDNCPAGSTVIVCSTVQPRVVIDLAAELAPTGIGLVDAPVSRGVRGAAETGNLTTLFGGRQDDFERLADVMRSYSAKVLYLGAIGAGQAAKLVNNACSLMNQLVLMEALTLGYAYGLNEPGLMAAINESSGRSHRSETWGWIDELRAVHPAGDQFVPLFAKDLWYAAEAAKAKGVELPIAVLGAAITVSTFQKFDQARPPSSEP